MLYCTSLGCMHDLPFLPAEATPEPVGGLLLEDVSVVHAVLGLAGLVARPGLLLGQLDLLHGGQGRQVALLGLLALLQPRLAPQLQHLPAHACN